jgi:transposase
MKKHLPYHLEIQTHRKNCYGIIRSSYREDGKVKHNHHGRLTGLTYEHLKKIQAAFRGDVLPKDDFKIMSSREYGASRAILQLAKSLGLDKSIYSRTSEQWVQDCLAMTVGRLIYAGSKLSLSNMWKDSALWELCGVKGKVDVDEHCYSAMDKLLERQEAIQKKLAEKHLQNGSLVLYDITSVYLEGEYEDSKVVKHGYNRDKKLGRKQIVLGLLCNSEGCPVAIELYAGNTQDAQTVEDKIKEIQDKYQIKDIIFVGDRGMITHANYEKFKDEEGLSIISALTHADITNLLNRDVIQLNLFDDKDIVETIDPDDKRIRYCLCKNLETGKRETHTRQALLDKTRAELDKIKASKRTTTNEKIGERVGKVLAKTKMGKFVNYKVVNGILEWSFDEDKISKEKQLDGCYIITTNVSPDLMNKVKVVESYKSLIQVEQAFRNLKTVQIEVRPINHKTDDRIRCHIFLCMLSYYLQWHMNQRLQPLFNADKKGKAQQWSFELVIERLKSIRKEEITVAGANCCVTSEPDTEQQRILDLLQIKL